MRDNIRDMLREGGHERMSKVEGNTTRRETTTIGNDHYDVIYLQDYLAGHPELNIPLQLPLIDQRLTDAVAKGNTYWETTAGEKLGPSHFLELWAEQKAADGSLSVNDFLENLKVTHPEWIKHINSIQYAEKNIDQPIWLLGGDQSHPYPFDGMHRLTRAFLDNRESIKAIIWDSVPPEAKLESN